MLKILCCVKQVPDVDQMRMDPETGNLIRAGVPAILNPQDANALSAAVKVKEQYGAEITLITMGPPNAEAALRECLAVGADKAVLVTDRAFGNADTLATSYSIMSAAATQGSYDMIFCGKESLDGATGQMGAQLAQRFEAAQVTGMFFFSAAAQSTILYPVASTQMHLILGQASNVALLIGALFVSTISASPMRFIISASSYGVLSYTVSSPYFLSPFQLRSPGFSV